jgi:ubiquinone/menaquinone biosynthesis C-methylase UbiE
MTTLNYHADTAAIDEILQQATEITPDTFPETADIETSSDDYARRFAGKIGAWFLKIQEEATLNMLAPYPGAAVLDVGGGHGQITGPLLAKGYNVTVLGSSTSCQKRIQHFVSTNQCTFDTGNILSLPYADRAFDVVISYRLLPHVTRWQPYLAELTRVARQAVIIDFPTKQSVNYIAPFLFQFKKRVEQNTRLYTCFHESDLLQFFQSLGFTRGARYAQYFLPMVFYRMMKSPRAATAVEHLFRQVGLTSLFGSPIILKVIREEG